MIRTFKWLNNPQSAPLIVEANLCRIVMGGYSHLVRLIWLYLGLPGFAVRWLLSFFRLLCRLCRSSSNIVCLLLVRGGDTGNLFLSGGMGSRGMVLHLLSLLSMWALLCGIVCTWRFPFSYLLPIYDEATPVASRYALAFSRRSMSLRPASGVGPTINNSIKTSSSGLSS